MTEDPRAELERLRRQLARERSRRQAAEEIGDRLTSELYATVEELRHAQAEILDRSEQARLIEQVARRLRQAQDTVTLVDLCTSEIADLLQADRCQVHLSESGVGDWSDNPDLTHAGRLAPPPSPLGALLADHAGPAPIVVDLVPDDSDGGCRSMAAFAIRAASHHLGWLTVLSVEPRRWSEREIAISDGIAQDFGVRLLELQSAEEREAVRRLEELDRAKDELISTVSHELRTPLTSVRGYLELLDGGELGPVSAPSAKAIRIMTRNVERLDALVENLLRLSVHGAAPALDLSPVELSQVVAECHHSLAPRLEASGLALAVTTSPRVRPVLGDRGLVEQVLLNLLSNAIKFTPAGGRVSVDIDSTELGVALTVADTGIGIPEDELGSVFSRFFRSSLSVAGGVPGTGLGLAVTKSIIDLHGGRVDLESTQGVGTTVRIELPAAPPAADPTTPTGRNDVA